MRIAFGDCEIDPDCFELRRRGKPVKVEPKVFDVLLYLIEHRDRVVTKQELLDGLWPGESVSDSVLPRCIAAIRRAVGDTRTRQKVISTAHGRGYRFVAELVEGDPIEASSAGEPRAEDSIRQPAPRNDEPRGSASDFVGRVDGLERLTAALDRTRAGAGGISFIVGEPGIGKTRIADEFAARAKKAGFSYYIGRCHEGEGAPAYWPWLQILREAVARIEDDDALRALIGTSGADLSELMPELQTRLGEIEPVSGPEGEQARFRLYDAATRFLVRISRQQPLLIVLDDLHWADASSLGLLRFLANQTRDAPLLLVGTFRDVDVRRGHPLADLLGTLAREERCDRIALTGFDKQEIGAFIHRLTGRPPDAVLVETMRDMTEGNPFFVREIVHLLADQHSFETGDTMPRDLLLLPQGVRDAIGRRLDGLSPACNEALRAASVIGRSFRLGVLATMLESSVSTGMDDLLELLAEALEAGIIAENARGRFAFAHALTRQTLYEELRGPQRTLLHRRAGEALERDLDPTRPGDENITELAHHFYEAAAGGDVDKSIAYSVSAAEWSHRKHAYDEAVGFYERAVDVLTLEVPIDEPRRAELLLALGEAIHIAGDRAAALTTLDRAIEIARQLEDWDLLARAAIAIRGFGELGTRPAQGVLDLLHEALEHLPAEADKLHSQLLSRLTHSAGSMQERDSLSVRALELAQRSGDSVALRDAWFASWWATLGPDRIERRFEVVLALRELADRTGDIRTRLLALECEIGGNFLRGDRGSIESNLREYEEVAAGLRQPGFIFMGMNYRTSWLINQGRFEEAEALVEQAYAYGIGVVPFAEMICRGQRYWSKSSRGADVDHPKNASEIEGLIRTSNLPRDVHEIFSVIMRYSYDHDGASAHERIRGVDYRKIDRNEHWLLCITSLADIAVDVGDQDMARWLYRALMPYADLIAIHDLMRIGRGSVGFTLGLLAVALGEPDAAVGHFERAIAVEEAGDMRLGRITSQVGLAGALGRRSAVGDEARARDLLQAARIAGERLALGEGCRVMRFLLARGDENPFDSDAWRRIQAS